MEETFEREMQRAQRKQLPLAVIMADIDGFKAINDNVGHVLGDSALVRVAVFLAKSIRASDVACRYGGDEFCLILPDCSPEEGIRRANALRTEVEKLRFDPKEAGIESITMSFGVSSFPEDGLTREALLSAADSALYSAKRAGRNRVNGQNQHLTQP
jgi:diguanylate cyclase (GGDEF)-like protein